MLKVRNRDPADITKSGLRAARCLCSGVTCAFRSLTRPRWQKLHELEKMETGDIDLATHKAAGVIRHDAIRAASRRAALSALWC